jgi:hypothetical protein
MVDVWTENMHDVVPGILEITEGMTLHGQRK